LCEGFAGEAFTRNALIMSSLWRNGEAVNTKIEKRLTRAHYAREGFSEGGREGWGYRTVKKLFQ